MEIKLLRELFEKWKSNTISDSESKQLRDWLRLRELEGKEPHWDENKKIQIRDEIFHAIQFKRKEKINAFKPYLSIQGISRAAIWIGFLLLANFVLKYSDSPLSEWWTWHNSNKLEVKGTQPLQLKMEDGSEICLNAGSILFYPKHFTKTLREVYLKEGEAFFKIHHEPDRGFKVISSQMITEDIGTSFDIKSYQKLNFSKVSVLSGSVSVQKKPSLWSSFFSLFPSHNPYFGQAKSNLLIKNQSLIYDKNAQKFIENPVDTRSILLWQRGDLRLVNELAFNVIHEIEIKYGVEISYPKEMILDIPITISFNHSDSIDEALKGLTLILEKHYKKLDSTHYRVL